LHSLWLWRAQYTSALGGLGTGIGDGDRGAICARGGECCVARDTEQETDCDAADAAEAAEAAEVIEAVEAAEAAEASEAAGAAANLASTPPSSRSSAAWSSGAPSPSSGVGSNTGLPGSPPRYTPSPQMGPGYERHEIVGIGGVIKRKLVRIVKVGGVVPEWDDEQTSSTILRRDVDGLRRSWCGWCRRVIPAKEEYDATIQHTTPQDRKGNGNAES
jgi:hypothetical protein